MATSWRTVPLIAVLLIACPPLLADGKMFFGDEVPPDIPYQRALLLFDGARETLILQSAYRMHGGKDAGEAIGWVVPVPALPEVASMPADEATDLFHFLSSISHPRVTRIRDGLAWLVLVISGASLLALILCGVSLVSRSTALARPRRVTAAVASIALVLSATGVFFVVLGSKEGVEIEDVTILDEREVGIYDAKVMTSRSAEGLIEWLNSNRFVFSEADRLVFDNYLRGGWCFAVAIVRPGALEKAPGEATSEGLVAPLILRFPATKAVYPLALTATIGRETEVLLYTIAHHRMQCAGRLDPRYAGPFYDFWSNNLKELADRAVEPKGFFASKDLEPGFLTKLGGRLTAEQMRQDLSLETDAADAWYEQQIVVW